MNNSLRWAAAVSLPVALLVTGCSSSPKIPNPTAQDYAYQASVNASHPGQNCYLTWQGSYVVNCYALGVQPPYSAKVYPPKGCTCPSPLPKPKGYITPKPVNLNKTTSPGNTPPKTNNQQVNKPVNPAPPRKK